MTTAKLKSRLHKLVEESRNKQLLETVTQLLSQPKKDDDFWDLMPGEEKRAIEEGIKELDEGKGIPHKVAKAKLKKWLSK